MSKKVANPYREGSAYSKVFNDLRKSGNTGVTIKGLMESGHSRHDITVVLSPREEGKSRGDCRGNMSAKGHLYFVATRVKDGDKRFTLRWRKTEMESHKRMVKSKVEQVKKVEDTTVTPEVNTETSETSEPVVA